MFFHGFTEENDIRSKSLENAYAGTYEELIDFCTKNNIDYVYVGEHEKNNLNINMKAINKLEKIKEIGSEELYKVNITKQ